MNVTAMSDTQKLEIVLRRTCALLPGDLAHHLLALLSPASLEIMAGVVVIWAAAHFVGVGEVADVILLVAGYAMIGGAAYDGGRKLVAFAVTTHRATSERDLDHAARDLADAITIVGVDVALAMLFRGRPKGTFRTVHKPNALPAFKQFMAAMPRAGPTRMFEARLTITKNIYAGLGGTNLQGTARVGRNWVPEAKPLQQAVREFRKTVYHERVHQRLTQGFSLLGRPALYTKLGAYKRLFLLRYIEEAAAEAYGKSEVGGHQAGDLTALEFPLRGPYGIGLEALKQEAKGILLGPVTVGATWYQVHYGLLREH